MLICHPAAGPAVHQDTLFQLCYPIFSTAGLELTARNSSDQRLPATSLNPDLRLFLFNHVFTEY